MTLGDSLIIDDNNENHLVAKLVLLGESNVGKSSLVYRFVKEKYLDRRENTIGAAFLTKVVQAGSESVKFEIWDTAGQERYHSLAPMYYRDAQAACVIYDITQATSFSKAKKWILELRKSGRQDVIIALVGNKVDLDERQVPAEEAGAYARENGLLFIETSAKTNKNINELFGNIALQLPKTNMKSVPSGSVILPMKPIEEGSPKDSGCCK